jgi:hypothetical protein
VDAVVASLSLHHIADLERKIGVYRAIFEALPAGAGTFVCLDATVSDDPRFAELTLDRWVAGMNEHGIDEAAARRHLADWAEEERYFPLHVELGALARAGFSHPECFWRKGSLAIYGARR